VARQPERASAAADAQAQATTDSNSDSNNSNLAQPWVGTSAARSGDAAPSAISWPESERSTRGEQRGSSNADVLTRTAAGVLNEECLLMRKSRTGSGGFDDG
jgi:hypothetical protein